MMKDTVNEKKLEKTGWIVLRFWGLDIKKNVTACVKEIKETINEIKNGKYQDKFRERDLIAAESEPEYEG